MIEKKKIGYYIFNIGFLCLMSFIWFFNINIGWKMLYNGMFLFVLGIIIIEGDNK